jgi:ribosome-binding factor A
MPKEFSRSARVSSEMQKELAFILQREINDPRLGFITINEVVLTQDLASAKIYITVFNADEQSKIDHIKWLNALVPTIRHLLAKKMRLRHISELKFFYDNSYDTGMRVAELLADKENSGQDKSDENKH